MKNNEISIRNNSEAKSLSTKRGKDNPNWKPSIKIKCKYCNNIFEVNQHQELTARFCSKYCHGKWRSENCLGKNNANFGKKWTETQKMKGSILTKKAMQNPEIIKKMKDNHADFRGIKNPNYIHGEGYFPYPIEFNDKLKSQIRKRDSYTCQKCGITEEEHLIMYNRVLDVHHIDYNKENCKEDNLISSCHRCNIEVNYNRNYWIKYFKNKLSKPNYYGSFV